MYCFLHDDNELHEWHVCFKLEKIKKRFTLGKASC